MFPHKKMIIWQKAMDIVREVYILTGNLPESEKYELVSQMRRSAISIASNIAEGSYRRTKKDFLSFLTIAKGSLGELETQFELTQNIYREKQNQLILERLIREEMKALTTFIRIVRRQAG